MKMGAGSKRKKPLLLSGEKTFSKKFEKSIDISPEVLYYNQRRVSDQSIAG